MSNLKSGLFSSLKDPIQGMDHKDFYKLAAKYKFSLAMENGICDDYITEKVWRPLMVGSLPVVMGSPKIKVNKRNNLSTFLLKRLYTFTQKI